jgi:hypothetical protein
MSGRNITNTKRAITDSTERKTMGKYVALKMEAKVFSETLVSTYK